MARALADNDTSADVDDLRANSEAFFYKLDDMEFTVRKSSQAFLQDNEKYILCLETPETGLMFALLANTLRKLIKEDFSNQYSELVFTNLHSFIKINKQQNNENFPDILVCKVDIDEHLDQYSKVLTSWAKLVKEQSKKIIFVIKNSKYLEQNMLKTRMVNVLKIKFTELWEENETLNNYCDEKQQNNQVNLNKQIHNEVKSIHVNKEKENSSDNISLHGATEIIKPLEMLKLHGILSVNDVDEQGNTPLHLAASRGQKKIVKALLDYDVLKDVRNNRGFTPLHLATSGGHHAVVNTLLENDANVNATDETYYLETVLHNACKSNDVRLIKLLLRFGAEIETKTDKSGYTPLMLASSHGHNAAVTTLLEHGSNINAQNKHGQSPLHIAIHNNKHEVVLNLLQNGADLNLQDNYQKNAFDYAKLSKVSNLVRVIIDKHVALAKKNEQ